MNSARLVKRKETTDKYGSPYTFHITKYYCVYRIPCGKCKLLIEDSPFIVRRSWTNLQSHGSAASHIQTQIYIYKSDIPVKFEFKITKDLNKTV